jgi:hypothetical protein
MVMRFDRMAHRLVTVAVLATAGLGLGACENLADLIPDSKKPLPGERKLLFPEGVPGVSQGVPPELIGRNQQAQGQPGAAPAAAAPEPVPQEQAEEKPKPAPKPRVQRAARQQPVQREPAPQAEPAQPQQQQTSPWPSSPQQQPAQASPWPSAPAPGTFTR